VVSEIEAFGPSEVVDRNCDGSLLRECPGAARSKRPKPRQLSASFKHGGDVDQLRVPLDYQRDGLARLLDFQGIL